MNYNWNQLWNFLEVVKSSLTMVNTPTDRNSYFSMLLEGHLADIINNILNSHILIYSHKSLSSSLLLTWSHSKCTVNSSQAKDWPESITLTVKNQVLLPCLTQGKIQFYYRSFMIRHINCIRYNLYRMIYESVKYWLSWCWLFQRWHHIRCCNGSNRCFDVNFIWLSTDYSSQLFRLV